MYSVSSSTASCPPTERTEIFLKQEVYAHQPNGHLTSGEMLTQQPPQLQPQPQPQTQPQTQTQHQQQSQHHHHHHHHHHHQQQQQQQQKPQQQIKQQQGNLIIQQQPKQVFDLGSFGNSRKPYRCSTCRKGFTLRAYLNRHQLAPEEEKHFYCQECGKAFSQRDKLKNHERTHSGEKPFACTHCDKAFSQRDRMKNHERTHHGIGLDAGAPNGILSANGEGGQNGVIYLPRERPYLCGACHKSFARKDHLRKHQRTHTGERPFQCGVCMKAFSRRDHLKKHQRTHSGEKPYECFVCSKAYSRKDHLNKHERTHTTGDMVTAANMLNNNNSNCGVNVSTASAVLAPASCAQQDHQIIDQKPPKCKYCPEVFATQNQLDLHELIHNQPQEELQIPISINLNPSSALTQQPLQAAPQHIQLTNIAPIQQISLQPAPPPPPQQQQQQQQQQQHQLQQQLTSTASNNVHQLLSQPIVATALRQPLLQTAQGQTATITINPGALAAGNYTSQPITLQQPLTMATANNYAWTNSFPVSSAWATGWVNPSLYTLDQQKCDNQETTHNIQTLLQ